MIGKKSVFKLLCFDNVVINFSWLLACFLVDNTSAVVVRAMTMCKLSVLLAFNERFCIA